MIANVHTTKYIDMYISYDIESTVVRPDIPDQHAPRSNELRAQTFLRSFFSYITPNSISLFYNMYTRSRTFAGISSSGSNIFF